MWRSAYIFLLLASDYSRNLSFLKQKYRQRVFTTAIRNPTKFKKNVVYGLFCLTMGRGGAGRSWCQSTPRLWQCCMWGGTSSWPGLEQGLGRMEVVRDCKCECPLWPLFASDSWVQGQDGSLPLVLVELVQSCSMVMEELGERETIVEGSRRRWGAQVAVTEVTQVLEILNNGGL